MNRFLLAAALCSLSLSACARQSAPDSAGQKITVGPKMVAEPTYAAGTPEARARAVLRKLNPQIRVERIDAAQIPGFREVIASGQVVYISDDGKYMLQGPLLEVAGRKDLSETAMAKVRNEILKTLPVADRIVFAPVDKPRHTVVVLTDIECGYCRKFHEDIAEYTRRGIEVEYLAFPRNGLASADYRNMVSVWCAPDRKKALTDAKHGRAVPSRTCQTPVDMQYRAGQRMGLTGTPMILSTRGELLGGYLPPDELLKRLDALEAPVGGA